MKNKNWQAIHEVYTKLETLCQTVPGMPDSGRAPETGLEEGPGMVSEELVTIRSELRTQLDFLKATLSEQYSERDSYLILFPIVAQIDEVILGHYLDRLHTGWPALQKELFQIDNAGEVFFEILDDILLKPQTALFIFEVYYFCLNYGFRGRYQDNPVKIKTYMKKLFEKLEPEELEGKTEAAEENVMVTRFGSRALGYAVSGGGVLGAFLLLLLIGRNLL